MPSTSIDAPAVTEEAVDSRVTVRLPDIIFKNFWGRELAVNQHYDVVRQESEAWVAAILGLTPKQQRRVNLCNFSYFIALLLPHCPKEKLKVVMDWGNWVFPFDDIFDEGELTDDPAASEQLADSLLSIMLQHEPKTSKRPVVLAHDDIFLRIRLGSTPHITNRFIRAMESYLAGVLKHIKAHASDRILSIQEMVDTRRVSSGVFPLYPMIEFAYDLDLPEYVFQHPSIRGLEDLGADFVAMVNDMVSYMKEEKDNCPFNMVAAGRMNGLSAQDAFDHVGSLMEARFVLWRQHVDALPTWGPDVDAQVEQYVGCIHNVVQAIVQWSLCSGRYLGASAEDVRLSREVEVLKYPPFLSQYPRDK